MYIQAQVAPYKKDSKSKIAWLEELLSKYPQEKEAHWLIGNNLYSARRDIERACKEFEEVLALDPDFAEAYLYLGLMHMDDRDFEKSLELLRKYASLSRDNANVFDTIGELFFKWGKLDKSVANREKAVKMNPDLGGSYGGHEIYWALAYTEALRGNYERAFEWLDRQLERKISQICQIRNCVVRSFLNLWLGRFEQALLELEKAEELIESRGQPSDLNEMKAVICLDKGDYEVSREYFNSSTPPSLRLLYLGLVDLKQGNLDSARARLEAMKAFFQTEKLRQYFSSHPLDKDKNYYFLDILDSEIGLSENKADLDSIIKSFAGDRVFLDQGNYNLWNTMHAIGLHYPPFARDFIPRAYLQNGDLDKAIEAYERLVTFNPESIDRRLIHPLNYYRLAKVYERKGIKGKARANYRKFLKLWKDADPGTAEVEDAKKRLAAL
jgi:tetratricopeptide (TPR) repeat protein